MCIVLTESQTVTYAGPLIEPTPTIKPKYNAGGGFTTKSFSKHGIPTTIVRTLVEAANHSLSSNTHRTYKTAVNHIRRVEAYTGRKLVFPFTAGSTLTYIGYLIQERNVGAASLEKYLSAIRMYHMQQGHFSPWLRPEVVKNIITGTANRRQIINRMNNKRGRLPVTPEILKVLKINLKSSKWTKSRKRTIWLCCTLCWAGAFRIHEILSREKDQFDPTSTLMFKDVSMKTIEVKGEALETLRVLIKHPKEERLSAGVTIDLFQVQGSGQWMCPVRAWKDWLEDKAFKQSATKPAIRLSDGSAYTGCQFNKDLKVLLGNHYDYDKDKVTAHSFRSGLATWMSKAGYKDEEIMAIGRWHSSAFLRYIKAPREKRALLAAELNDRIRNSLSLE